MYFTRSIKKALFLVLISFAFTPFAFSKESSLGFQVVNSEIYQLMNKKEQLEYINSIRQAWLDLESSYTQPALATQFQFFNTAYADSSSCIVGGAEVPRVKLGDRNVCSTKTRPCDNSEDSFKCGEIFSSTCIKRNPISTLSRRCYEASQNALLSPSDYEKLIPRMNDQFKKICLNNPSQTTSAGCVLFGQRIFDVSTPESPLFARSNAPAQSNKEPSRPLSKALSQQGYKDCPSIVEPKTKQVLYIPKFGVTESHVCQYNKNQDMLSAIAKSGCSSNPPPLPRYKTEITTGERPKKSLFGFVASLSEEFKKARDEVIYAMTFFEHDLNSPKPTRYEEKRVYLRKKGDDYFLLPSHDPNATGTKVKINNVASNSINVESDTTNIHLEAMLTATRCSTSNALRALPRYHAIAPASSSRSAR